MRSLVQAPVAGTNRSVVVVRAFGGLVLAAFASLVLAGSASALEMGHSLTGSIEGSGANALTGDITGVAVDNSGGPSQGDVYVSQPSAHRVEKFDGEGSFILMFGDGVNATTGGDVCTAASGDTCQAGVGGNSAPRLMSPTYIAVDPGGYVYVADAGEKPAAWTGDDSVHKYDEDGNLQTTWGELGRMTGSSEESKWGIEGLGVLPTGELLVYDVRTYPVGLQVVNPDGTPGSKIAIEGEGCMSSGETQSDIAVNPAGTSFYRRNSWIWSQYGQGIEHEPISRSTAGPGCTEITDSTYRWGYQDMNDYSIHEGVGRGIAMDPVSGTLYGVEEAQVREWQMNGSEEPVDAEGFACAEFCKETHSFGGGELADANLAAVNGETDTVYVTDKGHHRVAIYGPTALSKATTGEPTSNRTVSGEADPAGAGEITDCFFEYGDSSPEYGEQADCAPAPPFASPQAVTADLSGLIADRTYHYRLVVVNSEGGKSFGEDKTITPHPIDGLTTEAATNVEPTEATLHASFEGNGEATEYRFQWGTTSAYGSQSPTESAGAPTAPPSTPLEFTVEGLQPETTYHFRVVAENPEGTAYGADQTFTTPTAIHGLTTEAASEVGPTGAKLNGSLEGDGDATSYYYEYGTGFGYGVKTATQSAGSPTGPTPLPATVEGLQPETTYHFRVVATNSVGTSYGNDQSFTTDPAVAGATTLPATEIGQGHVTLNGEFDGNGENTHYYFEYGKTTAYGKVSASAPGADAGAPTGPAQVSTQITDYVANATYHYRVVLTNALGVTYGNDMTFTTLPAAPPAVSGTTFSDLSPTGARLEAQVNPNRAPTSYSFQYGTSTEYGSATEISKSIGSDAGVHTVTALVSGLAPGVTYHFRVVATNLSGTTYGPDQVLTTPDAPAIADVIASGVGLSTAHLSAGVNPHSSATMVRFEYGTTSGYGSSTAPVDLGPGTSTQQVAVDLAALAPGTTYHFRVVASNGIGTSVSADQTFTTQPAPSGGEPGPHPKPQPHCKRGFVKRHGKCVKKHKKHHRHSTRRHG